MNLSFLATFIYLLCRSDLPHQEFWRSPSQELTVDASYATQLSNAEILQQFDCLSFDQLIGKLENEQPVEEGYLQRDLSLGVLVKRYQFHLAKALDTLPQQMRQLSYIKEDGSEAKITLFPGLTEENFRAIIRFAMTERWPLTSKGLFQQLKRAASQPDRSLLDAFYQTGEFLEIETFLQRAGIHLSRDRIIEILCTGNWRMLERFLQTWRQQQDYSQEKRREFLTMYIHSGSRAAAHLLLQHDAYFMLRRATDAQILFFLELLEDKTPELEEFAHALLTSARCDAVLKKASCLLYDLAGESLPEPYQHSQALARFAKLSGKNTDPLKDTLAEKMPKKLERASHDMRGPRKVSRLYVVEENDSLWKIARKFDKSVESLKSHNQLQSDQLQVGQILKIPS